MPISFSCHGCGAAYSVKDEFGGKQTRCKKCNAQIQIPYATSNELDPPDIGFIAESDYTASAPAASSESAPEKKRMPLRGDVSSPYAAPQLANSVTSAPAPSVKMGRGTPLGHTKRRSYSGGEVDSGTDSFALTVTFGYLVLLVIGSIARYVQSRSAGLDIPFWYVIATSVVNILGHLLVVTPATLLGAWLSCKIFGRQLPPGAYIRASAVWPMYIVALVVVTILCILLLPVGPGTGVIILFVALLLCAVPVWAMGKFFGMDLLRALVATGITLVVTIIGSVVIYCVFGAALAGLFVVAEKATDVASRETEERSTSSGSPRANGNSPVSPQQNRPVVEPDNGQKAIDLRSIQMLKTRANGLAKRSDAGGVRELYNEEIDSLRTEIVAGEPKLSAYGEFGELKRDFAALELKIAALPSREPDPEVFNKPSVADAWDAGEAVAGFTTEMTVLNQFFLRLPPTALMDLTSDTSQSAKWRSPDGAVTFTLTLQERADPKQHMPWVVLPSMTLMAREKQLMFLVSDDRKHSTGTVGSIVFTRGQRSPTETSPFASLKYIGLVNDKWLIADISAPQKDDGWFGQFENAVRTLRKKGEKEQAVDPLAPQFIVHRLADSPEAASTLLRKADKAAEPLLLEIAAQAGHPARVAAVNVLADVATEKSAEVLWELSRQADPLLFKPARDALRRIVPDKASSISFAIEDLNLPVSPEVMAKKKEALVTLASTVADARRDAVAILLETILAKATPPELLPEAGAALAVWSRKETVDVLLPYVLSTEGEQNPALDSIIRALGGCNDKRVVMPILSWAGKRLPAVTDACITLGPTLAEEDLIKLLSLNAQAKSIACDILGKVGTSRAIFMLDRVSKDKNAAADLQNKAREAISSIKLRESSSKPPKKP